MRKELLSVLACPLCGSPFELIVLEERDGQTSEGLLRCSQSYHLYPIVRSIPRLLPMAFEQEHDFTYKFRDVIAKYGHVVDAGRFSKIQVGTMKSFGREWNTYAVQRPDEDKAYFRSKTGIHPNELQGKLVLDAGCGSGRYAKIAGEAGATVIGIDLSTAVERAVSVVGHLPNVHIIQADILCLPFLPKTFDFIYSIGVLHHTPNTKQALKELIPILKEQGEIAIWLYPRWPLPVEMYNNMLRAITTRISLDTLHRLAVVVEPIGLLKLQLLTSENGFIRGLGQLLRGLTIGVSYHPDRELRICDTFDWFSPPYQWHHTDDEVKGWFLEYGLDDIINLSVGQHHYQFNYGKGINIKARKPAIQTIIA